MAPHDEKKMVAAAATATMVKRESRHMIKETPTTVHCTRVMCTERKGEEVFVVAVVVVVVIVC